VRIYERFEDNPRDACGRDAHWSALIADEQRRIAIRMKVSGALESAITHATHGNRTVRPDKISAYWKLVPLSVAAGNFA
jgi:hypothetical protein